MKPKVEPRRDWGEQLVPDRLIPAFILQGSISRYLWVAQFVDGKTVLEVGCGSGYGTGYLSTRAGKRVVGGDMSSEAIGYATKHYRNNDTDFLLLDAARLPFPDACFDIVVSFEVLEHVVRYDDFVSECHRVLREDGVFVCSTPNKQIGSPGREKPLARYHYKEFYASELNALLTPYYREVNLYGIDPQHEGNRFVYQMATMLQPIIFSVPKSHVLTNLITKAVFRRYHLLKLSNMDCNLEKIPTKRYEPYVIQENAPVPGDLIAIGCGKKV